MSKIKNALIPVRSTDGTPYVLNVDTNTVKKVPTEKHRNFVINDEVDALVKDLAADNTKILAKFLKDHFADATFKHGWVHVMDYKIKYDSHGFLIRDMRNFGEIVNINDYHNDFPNPEAVLEFINNTVGRPKIEQKTIQADEVKRGELYKLASLGKVKIELTKGGEEVVTEIKQTPKKDRLHMEVLAIFKKYADGEAKYKVTLDRLTKRLPNKIKAEVVAVFKKLHKGEIIHRKAYSEVNKIMVDYLDFKKAEKPVRAPKFEAPELWEPLNLRMIAADIYSGKDGKDVVVTDHSLLFDGTKDEDYHYSNEPLFECVDPDIMWMRFETRGVSNKRYTLDVTLEEYLANVVLHHFPKAMPMLVKLAKGELQKVDITKMSRNWITDPFCIFDKMAVRHPVDRWEFCRVCYDIIHTNEIDCATEWVYTKEFKVGQKIRVVWPDYGTTATGEVISNEAGVEVRYEDGSVAKLMKHHIVVP